MRWKITPEAKNGEGRRRLVFAWWPTKVAEYIVFLEYFQVHEQYLNPRGLPDFWITGWVELSRSPCFPKQPEQL